ncbi:DUF2399 domain-containing protein [Blastococcus saxobsidens]|uniref:DUF2399 domain-containing protein n=1 Tax=Blastococcus saxobsidens (strain DD2) TaxID=1146883 RepID=H6RV35_BLASD|nr:DUF2399 domain-containing protein [Blastococcus saxobsidens]CCG05754.1 conserved protein of unknown function [Blastococcus saxobsidens DD2]
MPIAAAGARLDGRQGGRALAGRPVDAGWDPTLTDAMTAYGQVVEEERVADVLVDDLDSRRTSGRPPRAIGHA